MKTWWSMHRVPLALVFLMAITACGGCSGDSEKPPQRTATVVDPAKAGAIRGLVLFAGTPPPRRPLLTGGDSACAQTPPPTEEHLIVTESNGRQIVQNAFVWISKGLGDFVPSVPDEPVVVGQKFCIFRPRVVGVQRYQTITFTNSDHTEHNVKFAEPGKNPAHDKTMTSAGQSLSFWFPEEHVAMKVICSKHSWMRCWVAVVDHPFFAVTKEDGAFELRGVPAGTYTLSCWTEALGVREQSVTVAAGGTATAEFSFTREE